MPALPTTTRGIDALLASRPAERTDYFDAAHKGLSLRVGSESATWYFLRRVDGKLHRVALGPYPTLSLKAARAKLAELIEAAASGQHPRAEIARERAAKAAERRSDHDRLASVIGVRWLEQHLKPTDRRSRALSDSAARDYRRGLEVFLAEFGKRDLSTIRRSELVRFLRSIKGRRSGNEANRVATVVRQLFAYALDELDMDASPAALLKNPQKPKVRDRTLTREEIRVLWRACELAGYPYGSALQLALCTGQRIGEVGAIRRDEIEGGEWWAQSDNKAKRRIDVYLAPLARSIIEAAPNFGRDRYVLSSRIGESGIRSDVWKFARARHIEPRLEEAAAALTLPPIAKHWTPHDLRRTVRTALTGWCGVTPDVAERVLNHAITGLRAHYDWADYRPHMKDALIRWDAELQRIIEGKAATVVAIESKKRRRA